VIHRIAGDRRGQALDDIVVQLAAERDQLVALLVAQVAADAG